MALPLPAQRGNKVYRCIDRLCDGVDDDWDTDEHEQGKHLETGVGKKRHYCRRASRVFFVFLWCGL